jgi:muramoyltetrapeptide carboxypeptidase
MQNLPILKPGDNVEIIAPASRCSDQRLDEIKNLLTSWQLNCIIAEDIFGKDLLCANTDQMRFIHLKNALYNPTTKAVICASGGYGCTRLIPELLKVKVQQALPCKVFIGMSDMTSINLFLQQYWRWPVLHAAPALGKFSSQSIQMIKEILFGEINQIELEGFPLNLPATKELAITSSIIGGNLSLVQAGIGTSWQLNGNGKIVLLEEVNERGYRIDRMLEHLSQSNIFKNAAAIMLGDFVGGNEPNGTSLVQLVLERFAKSCEIPVIQIKNIGHGNTNYPLPLGTKAQLHLGTKIKLICHSRIPE